MGNGHPQDHEYHQVDDGVHDSVTGRTYKKGADGRLEGSFPLEEGISRKAVERLEGAQRFLERRNGPELDWQDGQD